MATALGALTTPRNLVAVAVVVTALLNPALATIAFVALLVCVNALLTLAATGLFTVLVMANELTVDILATACACLIALAVVDTTTSMCIRP